MWARDAARLPATPGRRDAGGRARAGGVYAARGELQVSIKTLQAQGDGLWRKALDATRARLAADGLLDPARKRALPRYPRRVAVITSPDGAALHDIRAVVRRRCPSVELVVVPAKVQGDGARRGAAGGRRARGRWRDVDAVIIGRGGGGARTCGPSTTSGSPAPSLRARCRPSARSATRWT
jgi:exodeoxyribonuclease VII large subunit